MKTTLITKIMVTTTILLFAFLIALGVFWIWEIFTQELLQKMFLTDILLLFVFGVATSNCVSLD